MKKIANQYSQLTAEERFRLFVEAMSRKDEQELDCLDNTCPRRRYVAQDDAYTRRKMFFAILALTTALCNLRTDAACLFAMVAALAADDSDEANTPASEKALSMFRRLMLIRQGKRQGWVRFCKQVGVDSDAITSPFLGEQLHWLMQPAEAAFATLELDPCEEDHREQIAEQELEALSDVWASQTT